jgi:ribosomal protein S18 acetylase RimI-like enzyme
METKSFVTVRRYEERDFPFIHELNRAEGWNNLVEKHTDAKKAWHQSNAAFVAEREGELVGCLRGLTDGYITLYVAELLVHPDWRRRGIGKELLSHVHSIYPATRLELLASQTSRTFYELHGYRPFHGFRKSFGG